MAGEGVNRVDYEVARRISRDERDVALELNSVLWPGDTTLPEGWTRGEVSLCREVHDPTKEFMAGAVHETLLRFPSAPLHGWQRLHEHHVNLKDSQSENFHTYRVFTHPEFSGRATRIFLMHNGLNELNTLGLYYQLASHLVRAGDHSTVCILRPFPGHLTRFPFEVFGETPLERYLWDGSHLFRQFLRYMIETQWFLSAIVRRSSYRSLAGGNLLGEHVNPRQSRLRSDILAKKTMSAWMSLYRESKRILAIAHLEENEAPTLNDPPQDEQPFRDTITSLRKVLKLRSYKHLDGSLGTEDQEPSVHVMGYSLGGFTAQSVFMSWPFLVASCVTLLSGGALRELSPTAFAHAEEWQTVLHSLRYELDDIMMSGRHRYVTGSPEVQEQIAAGQPDGIEEAYAGSPEANGRAAVGLEMLEAGIEPALFPYLKRTFYEVFQQEYRGSFQSRLQAFRQRMLFIVGGNDPIVHTRSVLDSGPPGGINMLAIGGLGHFLDAKARDEEEAKQRSFWLPEMGRVIDRFSRGAAESQVVERPYTWLDEKMEFVAYPPDPKGEKQSTRKSGNKSKPVVKRLSASERLAAGQDGALPGELFERYLDDLLVRQAEGNSAAGLLFVLRNEIPTMLLDKEGIYEHAALLNHDDVSIARYAQGVRGRRTLLEQRRERIALVLPWNAKRIWWKIDKHRGYPSQAEAAKGEPPVKLVKGEEGRFREEPVRGREQVWTARREACEKLARGKGLDSVRVFDGRNPLAQVHDEGVAKLLERAAAAMRCEGIERVPSLPDCWLWVSSDFLRSGAEDELTIANGIDRLVLAVTQLCETIEKNGSLSVLESHLQKDDLRLIKVSRARYNPRFRGRIVTEPRECRDQLLHATLCIATSVKLARAGLDGSDEGSGSSQSPISV